MTTPPGASPQAHIAIDVILRTHNRADMLGAAIDSFLEADHTGVTGRLLVVDNASTDHTAQVIGQFASRHGNRIEALHEQRPGGQHALNRALREADADIVAFFDDDERMDRGWLQTIRKEFADSDTDYIAGPVQPCEGSAPLPEWLPAGFNGVLGIIDNGPHRFQFQPGSPGMLTQGNCALRRSIFDETGPYPDELPTAEDRWLNGRLRDLGKRGFYCPDLLVSHVMQPRRMTRSYFRDWAAREGRDLAICDRLDNQRPLILKRWYLAEVARSAVNLAICKGSPSDRFRRELELRVFAAYLKTQAAIWTSR